MSGYSQGFPMQLCRTDCEFVLLDQRSKDLRKVRFKA